jgi:hypothetical protein
VNTPKPICLIDVDGPLSPYRLITKKGYLPPKRYGEDPAFEYEKHLMNLEGWTNLPVLLSKAHGDAFRELSEVFTLVWATTWVEDANRLIAPIIGLPCLPVIEWPYPHERNWASESGHRGSWKTKHIAKWLDDYAPGVPWVFIDDEIGPDDRTWWRSHYGIEKSEPSPVPYLLLRIEPSHGLRPHNFRELREWGQRVTEER